MQPAEFDLRVQPGSGSREPYTHYISRHRIYELVLGDVTQGLRGPAALDSPPQRHGRGDLLLINWHVVHRRGDAAAAVSVTAEFGCEDVAGALLGPTLVRRRPAALESDQQDDWAVVRCLDPRQDSRPSPG